MTRKEDNRDPGTLVPKRGSGEKGVR